MSISHFILTKIPRVTRTVNDKIILFILWELEWELTGELLGGPEIIFIMNIFTDRPTQIFCLPNC